MTRSTTIDALKENERSLNDVIVDVRAALQGVTYNVLNVADLLSEVGMDRLAKRLELAVEHLPELSKLLTSAYNEKLNEDISHSQAMAGNLLLLAVRQCTNREDA